MILFTVLVPVLLVGIVLVLVPLYRTYLPKAKRKREWALTYWEWLDTSAMSCIGYACIISFLILGVINGLFMTYTRYHNDVDYEQKVLVRQSIVEMIENAPTEYKDSVYQAAISFNNFVTEKQVLQGRFWTQWDFTGKYDWNDIELIVPYGGAAG